MKDKLLFFIKHLASLSNGKPVKVFPKGTTSFQNIYLSYYIADIHRLGKDKFNPVIQLVAKILDGIRHTIDLRETPLVTGCQPNFVSLTTIL
ncbi:hypothetical protein llap_4463 [Limosa lapponica baueri]|uniref:Uncharacterized protein n=1 Tax=Limosa lapponica baueri TaxID=1758121 RepID=A0A2I0UGR5_LIMLA|nr:hypothetical protein llap_4463 [Limosa lapponica baueri]